MFVMLFGYPPFHAEADADIFRLILAGFDPTTKKGYKAHFPAVSHAVTLRWMIVTTTLLMFILSHD